VENDVLIAPKICVADSNCQSRCPHPTHTRKILVGYHDNHILTEHDSGPVKREILCCVPKLYEVLKRKSKLVKELDCEALEERDLHPTEKRFQVSAT